MPRLHGRRYDSTSLSESSPPAALDATGTVRAGAVLLSWLALGVLAQGGVLALFGLPYRDWLVYVAHAAIFVLGPGVASYLWAAERPVPPLTLLTQGFCLGLCLETLAYLALLMAGHPGWIAGYPLPFALLFLARGRSFLALVDWSRPTSPPRALALLAVVLLVVFTTGMDVFDPVLNHHATWPVAYGHASPQCEITRAISPRPRMPLPSRSPRRPGAPLMPQ